MATLIQRSTNTPCHLYAHHSFGRLQYSVNTLIAAPEISKIHAVIEWSGDHWYLRDMSSNGTWLNGKRLSKDQAVRLNEADVFSLAGQTSHEFSVKDLNRPCDMLVPIGHDSEYIELNHYHLFPNQETPEIILAYNNSTETWWQEVLTEDGQQAAISLELVNNDVVEFAGKSWKLHINKVLDETKQIMPMVSSLEELFFAFKTSQDEESTQLIIEANGQLIDLQIRSHHYLTLTLARKRATDIEDQVDELSQGWLYTEELAKALGLEPCHLNIQIHRIRKQFVDALNNSCDSKHLIEREAGKLRFGSSHFQIVKGASVEFSTEASIAIG